MLLKNFVISNVIFPRQAIFSPLAFLLWVSTTPGNPGRLVEFEIAPGNTGI